jgi:hypothetical protein
MTTFNTDLAGGRHSAAIAKGPLVRVRASQSFNMLFLACGISLTSQKPGAVERADALAENSHSGVPQECSE